MIERAAASGVSLRRRRLQLRVGAAGALLAVTIALTSAADASAAIRIQRRTITVSGVGGLVSITRAPFGIAFTDRRGNRVLAEVPATSHTTTIRPASAPTVGGDNLQKSATLYAPLAFTVGSERESVFVGLSPEGDRLVAGQHEGDLIQSVRTGSVYSARAVRSIRRLGHGVRLVLSTTDPSGRRMILTVTPDQAGTFRVSAQPIPSHGVIGIADSFTSVRQEAFHGFGGVHDGLDQHGRDFYSRVEEENADPQEFGGPPSESGLFPSGPLAAYYAQPMFVSSRAYGFLLDQPQLARFRLDSDHPDAWQADVTGRRLQYVVALGSAPRAIAALTAVTGRQRVPPAWGLGPMLDRSTPLNGTVAAYEAKVRQDLVDIARYRLPLKAYRIEGWALFPRADLRQIIEQFHRRGIRVLLYFRPYVAHDSSGTEQPADFDYAIAHGLVARTPAGRPYLFGTPTVGTGALLDFTNPATVRWWSRRVRAALDLGADGFMQDFGEQVLPNMVFHDGERGATMHNRYPVIYDQTTREILDRYGRQHPRRIFFFTRAGYTGRPGNAAYENANFPGDESTDWTHASGLRSLITDMLNRAVGGAYGYGSDIGGYLDLGTPATSKELFLRWAELAALTPVFRLHGSVIAGTHTPWSYDAQTVRIYNGLSRLHLAAAKLILRLWRQAARTGIPVTRPLWLAYPRDRHAAGQEQEWLLGPDVLVAPVVTQGALSRRAYFPAGCWTSPATGQRVRGPRQLTVAAPLDRLPYFFRCRTKPFIAPRTSS